MDTSDPDARKRFGSKPLQNGPRWRLALITASGLLAFLVLYQFVFVSRSVDYLSDDQLRFQKAVIQGTAIDPWQYRILAPYLIKGELQVIKPFGVKKPHVPAFLATSGILFGLVFYLSGVYWRELGMGSWHTLIAVAVLAWGVTYSNYRSHLAFDTWFDVVFYLLAGIAILEGRHFWILPISVIAAFNRETAILIPVMLVLARIDLHRRFSLDRSVLLIASVSLGLFILIFFGIRLYYGPRSFIDVKGHTVGLDMLLYNLTSRMTYVMPALTFSILPLIGIAVWRKWPAILHRFFLAIVPLWLLVHPFLALLWETRLFMVPYVLILIPSVFLAAQGEAPPAPAPAAGVGDM